MCLLELSFVVLLEKSVLLADLLLVLDKLLNDLLERPLQQVHLQIRHNVLLDVIESAFGSIAA